MAPYLMAEAVMTQKARGLTYGLTYDFSYGCGPRPYP